MSRNFTLPIVVGNRFAEKTTTIRCPQRFKRIGIETVTTNSGENGVEKGLRKGIRFVCSRLR